MTQQSSTNYLHQDWHASSLHHTKKNAQSKNLPRTIWSYLGCTERLMEIRRANTKYAPTPNQTKMGKTSYREFAAAAATVPAQIAAGRRYRRRGEEGGSWVGFECGWRRLDVTTLTGMLTGSGRRVAEPFRTFFSSKTIIYITYIIRVYCPVFVGSDTMPLTQRIRFFY